MIFSVFQKKSGFSGIGATLRIGREMLCLPYPGSFNKKDGKVG